MTEGEEMAEMFRKQAGTEYAYLKMKKREGEKRRRNLVKIAEDSEEPTRGKEFRLDSSKVNGIIEFAREHFSTPLLLLGNIEAKRQYLAEIGYSTLVKGEKDIRIDECDNVTVGRAFYLYHCDAVKQKDVSR